MSPLALSLRLLQAQPDERLLALASDGHEPAFEALVRRYRRPLLAYCRRIAPEATAEDVLQQALLQAWRALTSGARVREARPWLYRIVRNAAISTLRGLGEQPAKLTDTVSASGVEHLVEQRLAAREALTQLAALPDLQREVMVGTAVEGRSHDEVAAALGLTGGSVRGLLYRARATLRAAAAAVVPGPVIEWAARQPGGRVGSAAVAEMLAGGGSVGAAGIVLKAGAAVTAAGVIAGAAAVVTHPFTHPPSRARDVHLTTRPPASPAQRRIAARSTAVPANAALDRSVSDGRPEGGRVVLAAVRPRSSIENRRLTSVGYAPAPREHGGTGRRDGGGGSTRQRSGPESTSNQGSGSSSNGYGTDGERTGTTATAAAAYPDANQVNQPQDGGSSSSTNTGTTGASGSDGGTSTGSSLTTSGTSAGTGTSSPDGTSGTAIPGGTTDSGGTTGSAGS